LRGGVWWGTKGSEVKRRGNGLAVWDTKSRDPCGRFHVGGKKPHTYLDQKKKRDDFYWERRTKNVDGEPDQKD